MIELQPITTSSSLLSSVVSSSTVNRYEEDSHGYDVSNTDDYKSNTFLLSNKGDRITNVIRVEDKERYTIETNRNLLLSKKKNSNKAERSIPLASPLLIQVRYVTLASICIFMSITCPGQTVLWDQKQNSALINSTSVFNDETNTKPSLEKGLFIQYYEWIQLLVPYMLVLVAFFTVHGSDPGCLRTDVMDRWYKVQNGSHNYHHGCSRTLLTATAASLPVKHHLDKNDEYENDEESAALLLQEQQQQQNAVEHGSNISNTDIDTSCNDRSLYSYNKEKHDLNLATDTLTYDEPLGTKVGGIGNSHNSIRMPLSTTRRKYCDTCQFYPPMRSHHCKEIQCCVATFDHYCYFIGTCIGERNHCKFYIFILCQFLALILCCRIVSTSHYSIVTQLLKVLTNHTSTLGPSSSYSHPGSINTTIYLWFQLFYVAICKLYLYPTTIAASVMVVVHTAMIVTNSTTFECSKGSKYIDYLQDIDSMDLPFSFGGPFHNMYHFCCIRNQMSSMNKIHSSNTNEHEQLDITTRSTSPESSNANTLVWIPIIWTNPHKSSKVGSNNQEWYNNLWRNKYWSCC